MAPVTVTALRPAPPPPTGGAPAAVVPAPPQQQQQQHQPQSNQAQQVQSQQNPPSTPTQQSRMQASTPTPVPSPLQPPHAQAHGQAHANPHAHTHVPHIPPQIPTQVPAQAAVPAPRTGTSSRFSHRRRGDVALSSEGSAHARIPPRHLHTPSVGTLPSVAGGTEPPTHGHGFQHAHPHAHAHMHAHAHTQTQAAAQQAAQAAQAARRQKPIFEWFRGKLNARRTSEVEPVVGGAKRAAKGPPHIVVQSLGYRRDPAPPAAPGEGQAYKVPLPKAQGGQANTPTYFGPTLNRHDSLASSALSRTESISLQSYSLTSPERRALNNPYPSLPIPLVRRSYPASTLDSESRAASFSFATHSRTSSLISLSSPTRRRDDDSLRESLRGSVHGSVHGSTRGSVSRSSGGWVGYAGYADEDASVRPIPPSPTRSMSIISRLGSEPLGRSDSLSLAHGAGSRSRRRAPGASAADRRDTYSSAGGATSLLTDDADEDDDDDAGADGGVSRQNSLASTKPTTVMSFDSNVPVAHIAVASPTASPAQHAAVSPPAVSVSASASASASGSVSTSTSAAQSPISPTFLPPASLPDDVRVPRHTRYHPRNNPQPTAPPGPDASTLTLASSTFALGGDRPRSSSLRSPGSVSWPAATGSLSGLSPGSATTTSPTVAFAFSESVSGAGASGAQYAPYVAAGPASYGAPSGASEADGSMHLSHRRGYGRCDDDASMRAIRRRGSWESAESRWSWRAGAGGDKDRENSLLAALGRPVDDDVPHNRSSTYTRESLRTAYSARTAPSSSHAHGSPAGQGVFGAAQSEGDLTALTSESALVSHRPVSVRV